MIKSHEKASSSEPHQAAVLGFGISMLLLYLVAAVVLAVRVAGEPNMQWWLDGVSAVVAVVTAVGALMVAVAPNSKDRGKWMRLGNSIGRYAIAGGALYLAVGVVVFGAVSIGQ